MFSHVLWAPGKEKDESAPDVNTPGLEPGTQWSEVECSSARPSTPQSMISEMIYPRDIPEDILLFFPHLSNGSSRFRMVVPYLHVIAESRIRAHD